MHHSLTVKHEKSYINYPNCYFQCPQKLDLCVQRKAWKRDLGFFVAVGCAQSGIPQINTPLQSKGQILVACRTAQMNVIEQFPFKNFHGWLLHTR